jgi:hypothetical protein
MSLTTTEGLTIADLEAMPDDGHRYELLGGSIVVNAAPAPRHQRASGVLNDLLRRSCPPGHEVFYAPVDLHLSRRPAGGAGSRRGAAWQRG